MSNSIHTVRWIKQLTGCGWDLHLFPSWANELHPELMGVTVHNALYFRRPQWLDPSVKLHGRWFPARHITLPAAERLLPGLMDKSCRLAKVIKSIRPDIVQSLEIQHAGYLTFAAREQLEGFPTWIVTNWGSDIYLYGRLAAHQQKLRDLLGACDYYDCECKRDANAVRELGFRGKLMPVVPNTGGFHLDHLAGLRQPGHTSARRLILLKGYQDTPGRALCGLRALAMCADELKHGGYRVVVYSASADVKNAAELVTVATGLPIVAIPHIKHEEMLKLHGRARASLGLAISDGVSTSFLEALAMGSFPIQSHTACADEWITDGESGILVPPEDPHIIARAIRRAVDDDGLVDRAAEINARTARRRLDYEKVQQQVIQAYRAIGREIGAKI